MRRLLRHFSIAVMAFMTSACEQSSPAASIPEPGTHEVTLQQVQEIAFPKVLWVSGEVVAARRINIVSRLSGYLRAVLVDEGDQVTRGRLLAEVDDTVVEAAIMQAKAGIASAKANLMDAKADVARFRKLASTQALAEDQLRNAQVRVVTTQTELDSAEAELRTRRVEREYVRLVAPEDAIVVKRLLEPGDLAGAGSPVLRLESRTPHELEVFVPVAWASLVELGETLPVKLDDGSELNSKVLGVISSADHLTRQVKVRLALPGDHAVLPGTYGQAQLILGQDVSPAVPASAITSRAGIEGVFVLDGDSRARFRSVRLGRRWQAFREVLAGVLPGSRVVLTPSAKLHDGDRVLEE